MAVRKGTRDDAGKEVPAGSSADKMQGFRGWQARQDVVRFRCALQRVANSLPTHAPSERITLGYGHGCPIKRGLGMRLVPHLQPPSAPWLTRINQEKEYMPGFDIRNHSSVGDLKVFVTKFSNGNGSDEWFNVPKDFTSESAYHWERKYFDLVAFEDPKTKQRRGWYLNPNGGTVQITFYGFDQELGLVRL